MLEKIISSEERILDIIKPTIEYDIPTVSGIILRAKIEIITEELDSNLVIILKDRVLSSELSDVLKDFKNMAVDDDDDDIKEPQSKKRKRNKCYYTKNITHGFQSSIANNKMDIIKCIQLFTQ